MSVCRITSVNRNKNKQIKLEPLKFELSDVAAETHNLKKKVK